MIEFLWSTTSSLSFLASTAACSNGTGNANWASPVCTTAARVLLSVTVRKVSVSTLG